MAKPTLALIPAAQGSKFYSVLPSNGVGDFDFTRSGSATRINKDGLIETVSNGVSRLNYPLIDGVVNGCPSHLLEPSRTNLIPRSEDIDIGWSKLNVTVANNQTISPYGTLSASLSTANSTNGQHASYDTLSSSVTSGQPYYISCFVKKSNTRYIRLNEGYTGQQLYYDFDNNIATINGGASNEIVEDFGNGWFRIGFKFVPTTVNSQFALYLNDSSNNNSYAGNGESVYLWGAQIEQGSYATSYIPTNGSAVTRSAETADGSGDAATFNDSEGVFMANLLWTATSSNIYISIDDNTSNNRILIYSNSTDDIKALVGSGGITQVAFTATNQDATIFNKVAVKYKQNDFALWINGIKLLTDTLGSTPIGLSNLGFRAGGGTNPLNGSIKQLQYFDSALTDSELEQLTSWVSFQEMAEGQLYTIE